MGKLPALIAMNAELIPLLLFYSSTSIADSHSLYLLNLFKIAISYSSVYLILLDLFRSNSDVLVRKKLTSSKLFLRTAVCRHVVPS